jgi:hypothetical protein
LLQLQLRHELVKRLLDQLKGIQHPLKPIDDSTLILSLLLNDYFENKGFILTRNVFLSETQLSTEMALKEQRLETLKHLLPEIATVYDEAWPTREYFPK